MRANSKNQTKRLFKSDQRIVLITIAKSIKSPPIVGVPALDRCDFGPSFLIFWPTLVFVSKSITNGPKKIVIIKEVSIESIVRSVMYWKTLKKE